MFDLLRTFIADIASTPSDAATLAEDECRLAVAALLVHVVNVDGHIDPRETVRLRQILQERFGLDAGATSRLIEKAEESDREAVDFFHFTNVLKRRLDDAGRHRIIEMMWDVVLADGVVSEFEENVVWRVAELLGISNRDRILLRQKVAGEASPPGTAGPWAGTRNAGTDEPAKG